MSEETNHSYGHEPAVPSNPLLGGIFCELCKLEIMPYEIILRRTRAQECPAYCYRCALDLCERETRLLVLARLDQYEDRNPVYPADLGRRTSNPKVSRDGGKETE